MSAGRRPAPTFESAAGDGAAANDNAPAVGAREVMSVEQTAAFLGVDRKTVYDFAARGVLPCRRLGRRILFSRQALVLWLGGACSNVPSNGESP